MASLAAASPLRERHAAFRSLELLARRVVEGFVTGLHRSPLKGFAVEFEQHRPYAAGDDIKHLDWKLLGKLDRCYVRQYEEDTSLRAYLVLDSSGSMGYGSGALTKFDYGRALVDVVSGLLLKQQDSVGLVTCDFRVRRFLSPRSGVRHMRSIMEELSSIEPGGPTRLGEVLHALADRIRRRALIVIVSDLFDDPAGLDLALNHFAHRRHEVIVFQMLDRREAEFPFKDPTRFESLEDASVRFVDPLRLRREYLRQFRMHQDRIREACHRLKIDLQQLFADDSFERELAAYLARRMKRKT